MSLEMNMQPTAIASLKGKHSSRSYPAVQNNGSHPRQLAWIPIFSMVEIIPLFEQLINHSWQSDTNREMTSIDMVLLLLFCLSYVRAAFSVLSLSQVEWVVFVFKTNASRLTRSKVCFAFRFWAMATERQMVHSFVGPLVHHKLFLSYFVTFWIYKMV